MASYDELLVASYSKTTKRLYSNAVALFLNKYGLELHQISLIPITYLDHLLSRYFLYLFNSGVGKAVPSQTLCGLDMYIPGIKQFLPYSRRALRGYQSLKPSSSRPPMPWTVCLVIAFWLARKGKTSMAIAVLVSFDCYLRIGEMLQLTKADVAMNHDPRLGLSSNESRVHIHIRKAKTGILQGCEIKNMQIQSLVLTLVAALPSNDSRVFQFSQSTYNKWLAKACAAIGVYHYTHHCLRHGGATRDYLNGVPIKDIMVRGRWAATKSAVHYIQAGRQLMMLQQDVY